MHISQPMLKIHQVDIASRNVKQWLNCLSGFVLGFSTTFVYVFVF